MSSSPSSGFLNALGKIPRWAWIMGFIIIAALAVFWLSRSEQSQGRIPSVEVRRGPLEITVLDGGSIRAVDSQEIKCEVRVGYQGIKILKIVEEGYEVTQEDIRTNKVLVELDSSELQKQIVQQDIQYETALASLTDAQQNYEIQINQNLSDIKAAEQKARFARMDFDKLLGANVTQDIVDRLGIEKQLASELTNAAAATLAAVTNSTPPPPGTNSASENGVSKALEAVSQAVAAGDGSGGLQPGNAGSGAKTVHLVEMANNTVIAAPGAGASGEPMTPPSQRTQQTPTLPREPEPAEPSELVATNLVDFSQYANIDALGDGEAKQRLRKLEDERQLAKKEQGQAAASLEGTKRLSAKGFVTRLEVEKEEITAENSRLKVETATTAQNLYLKYDFAKTAEEALSKYAEAVRELTRARKAAVSKVAQSQARLKSAQGQYNIQERQRKENYEQLEKCIIPATKPGLVVYGYGGDEGMWYGGEERVREGATVRERQTIITIPNMSKMSVRVNVHETYIRKVKKGQKARVTVDSVPDKVIEGEVTSVGVLPDSQRGWMNPDMKVYLTTITLTGTNEWLKPGMSAKVEILVDRLENVLYVPMQAVSPFGEKQVCYMAGHSKPEKRFVTTGEFNDNFIEIKSGLKEGERVLLRPAEAPPPENKEPKDTPKPAAKPAPAPGKA